MIETLFSAISQYAIPFLLFVIPVGGYLRGVKVYEAFIEGAKEGFETAVRIIPYLVAIFVAVRLFRFSGAMDTVNHIVAPITTAFGVPSEALPMILVRPLSGSGALSLMTELIHTYGPDSFIGLTASTLQGSTETTLYVLTVYFGAVSVKNIRHTLAVGLLADLCAFAAAIFICRLLFL